MSDKLTIYNMALGHLLEGSIASLSEGVEKRRVLDTFWDNSTRICLGKTFWKFAKRAIVIDASQTLTPSFGFQNAFKVPIDWIRSYEMSGYEQMQPPLLDVRLEAGYWYANISPLYLTYVSSNPQYGMNVGAWPEEFVEYVALQLAAKACKRITGKVELLEGPKGLLVQLRAAERAAMGSDAMNDPIKFPPRGSWATSRRGYRIGRGSSESGC